MTTIRVKTRQSTSVLRLQALNSTHVMFELEDMQFSFNRKSWEALGHPIEIEVTMTSYEGA